MLYLPDPRKFKLFVGLVLLYIGWRLFMSLNKGRSSRKAGDTEFRITDIRSSFKKVEFNFLGKETSFSVPVVFVVSLVIGIIGGIYGIGGGALMSPFLVSVLHIPVYVVSGAVLMGTFMTSIFGLLFYTLIPLKGGITAPPDWLLGLLFGLGGLCGMYTGARLQRYMPEKAIKLILTGVILIVSGKYIIQFFR
jgi:hypothetical protein